jgi:hypothetical protein
MSFLYVEILRHRIVGTCCHIVDDRVETISYMESVLLGDPFGFLAKWPVVLSRLPNLALCNRVRYLSGLASFI